jgi:poly-gamma-glutamate capsule biosynthesis protein CapA/YwtB (metallophosphatase superfamily)
MAIRTRGRALTLPAVSIGLVLAAGAAPRSQSPVLSITLTGQSTIRTDVRVHTPAIVSTVAPLLTGDVVFTNFEAAVVEKDQSTRDGQFLSPPESIDALKALGFNLLSLSNNHSWDLKVPGVQNTLRAADRVSLAHAGTGNTLDEASGPGYLRTPKGTVALVAMASGFVPEGGSATPSRPGVNELRIDGGNTPNKEDAQRILQSIRTASARADLVIVYQHNHVFDKPFGTIMREELPERLVPPEWLKAWTHTEIDAGADIVVMHGAPLLHGVEIYRGKPIFYDLGNFFFQVPPTTILLDEPIIWESAVASVEFRGKSLQSVTFRPIAMNKIGEGQPDAHDPYANNLFLQTRGLPKLATGEQAHYILERLANLSKPFGTTMVVTGETAQIRLTNRN